MCFQCTVVLINAETISQEGDCDNFMLGSGQLTRIHKDIVNQLVNVVIDVDPSNIPSAMLNVENVTISDILQLSVTPNLSKKL